MEKYTIGVDYGTLSGRALLVEVSTGRELASAVYEYPHAVMDTQLPCGKKLEHDWALQHPQDYLDVLEKTIPAVLAQSGVDPRNVIGIGTDFTACTVLPVKKDGTPLCLMPEYAENPHAWVKLWKHHAARAGQPSERPRGAARRSLARQLRRQDFLRMGDPQTHVGRGGSAGNLRGDGSLD